MPFRKIVGELVFGGVLDRHPSLRIMFAEAGINWLASTLQDVKMISASYNRIIDWKLQHPPAHYWHKNLYATFIDDPLGLSLIDQIEVDRALWRSEEHTYELQSLMRISYAVFCLNKN